MAVLDLASLTIDEWAALSVDQSSAMVLDPVPVHYHVGASAYYVPGSVQGQAVTKEQKGQVVTAGSTTGQVI